MALNDLLHYFTHPVQQALLGLSTQILTNIEEIRLRQDQPLMVNLSGGEGFVTSTGNLVKVPAEGYRVTSEDLLKTLQLLTNSSLYALEEELRRGFITIPGGHRVGMVGKTVVENGTIRTIKQVNALNIRIARQIFNVSEKLLPYVYNYSTQNLYHTLIISPPCCGKTTLLRDLIRQISYGQPKFAVAGLGVGLVDERSEVAGSYRGKPQLDVGPRTDVLDGCPKAEGMMLLIRSMNPKVIAVDEIGSKEDILALEEALNAGIKVVATVHGASIEEIIRRPNFKYIIQNKIFERIVILERRSSPGVIKNVLDGVTMRPLTSNQ